MSSKVIDHFNEQLKKANFQISVVLYTIVMAWLLGFFMPSILLL